MNLVTDVEALARTGCFIEAIVESLSAKFGLYSELEKVVPASITITIASSTSGLLTGGGIYQWNEGRKQRYRETRRKMLRNR